MKKINTEFGIIEISEIKENQINEYESRIVELLKTHNKLELDLLLIYHDNNREYKYLDKLDIDDILEFTEYIPTYIRRVELLESRISYLNTLLHNAKNNIFD